MSAMISLVSVDGEMIALNPDYIVAIVQNGPQAPETVVICDNLNFHVPENISDILEKIRVSALPERDW